MHKLHTNHSDLSKPGGTVVVVRAIDCVGVGAQGTLKGRRKSEREKKTTILVKCTLVGRGTYNFVDYGLK